MQVGEITSGAFSPCLKKNVAMGYVEKKYGKAGTQLKVHTAPNTGFTPACLCIRYVRSLARKLRLRCTFPDSPQPSVLVGHVGYQAVYVQYRCRCISPLLYHLAHSYMYEDLCVTRL